MNVPANETTENDDLRTGDGLSTNDDAPKQINANFEKGLTTKIQESTDNNLL